MPPESCGISGTLYFYADRVRIVAGRHEASHPRLFEREAVSQLPEHRAAHLAAIAGMRGKRYLRRQQVFELGKDAVAWLTEVVHSHPTTWPVEIDALHDLLQRHGPDAIRQALRISLDAKRLSVAFIARCLGEPDQPVQTSPFSSHSQEMPS